MSTNYPATRDSYVTAVDGVTIVDATDRNNLQAAVVALEQYSFTVFNVKTFGQAKGDGATDDTVAIINTINAAALAPGGVVYFPPGTYLISGTLNVPITVSIFGAGRSSIIKGAVSPLMAASGVDVSAGDIVHEFFIKDIQFQVTSTNTALSLSAVFSAVTFSPMPLIENVHFNANPNGGVSATLLNLNTVVNATVVHCDFVGFSTGGTGTSTGLVMTACANCHITDCVFTYLNTGVILQTDGGGHICQGIFFTSVHMNGLQNGVNSAGCTTVHFINGMIDNTIAIWASTTDSDIKITNCYLGRTGTTNDTLLFTNPVGFLQIQANHFQFYGTGNSGVNVNGAAAVNNCIIADNILGGASPLHFFSFNFMANFLVIGNNFSATASGSKIANTNQQGNSSLWRHNLGYNPVGLVTAPAASPVSTTVYTNTFPHYVRVFYFGGTISAIFLNGVGILQSTNTSIYLAPGETISATWSVQPSWAWIGD